MKTVCFLIDHPTLDSLLIPVMHTLRKRGVEIIPIVSNAGNAEAVHGHGFAYAASPQAAFENFIQGSGAKLFVNAADMHFPAHALGRQLDNLCRALGIPSLTLEHGAFSVGIPWDKGYAFDADIMAVWGASDFERYRTLGMTPKRLAITGCPKYDLFVGMDKVAAARTIRSRLGIEPGRGYVLLAGENNKFKEMGMPDAVWRATLSRLYRVLLEALPAYDIMVKPHPSDPYYDAVGLYREAVPDEARARVQVIPPDIALPDLVCGSAMVVTFSSSVLLESLILSTPVVFFSGTVQRPAVQDCREAGAVILACEWTQCPEALRESLADRENGRWRSIRLTEPFVKRYLNSPDGQSCARVAFLCDTMLERHSLRREQGVLIDWHHHAGRPGIIEDLSFERYQRFKAIADKIPSEATVLDVGSEDEGLKRLLPDVEYQSYNGMISSLERQFLPFEDAAFDVVVASDVLEHIVPQDRSIFLAELLRVARRLVIFSFPSESSARAEDLILSIIPDNKWLKEHRQQGLPSRSDIEASIQI